jgi:hypothetical protein
VSAIDKQYARVKKYIKRWKPILGLEKWEINIEMAPGPLPGMDSNISLNVGAECYPSYEYEAATIRFSVSEIAEYTEADLESLKLDKQLVLEEHLTTLLTRAFVKCQS